MSFDWNHAKSFLAVVDEGSLSAAAVKLGQTQPTISRQIGALEASLGATLFERTGRSVILTKAGADLVEHVRAMAEGANHLSLAASGQSQSIEGRVRITASEMMSAYTLPTILKGLREQAPQLELDVIVDNAMRDLVQREADIAIRHTRPEQPNLIAKRVGDDVMRFYASQEYLERQGDPTPNNLSRHQIVSFVDADQMLGYLVPAGLNVTRANFALTSSSQIATIEMARTGLGMMIMPERVADNFTDLEPALDEIEAFRVPTWLVTHKELHTSRRIRLVFDALAQHLS